MPDHSENIVGSEEKRALVDGLIVEMEKEYDPFQAPVEKLTPNQADEMETFIRYCLPKVTPDDDPIPYTIQDLISQVRERYPVTEHRVKKLIEDIQGEKSLKVRADVSSGQESSGTRYETYFENDPDKGIRFITVKRPGEAPPRYQDDIVISYYIHQLIKTVNPLEAGDLTYTISLRHCRKRREYLRFDDEDIGGIATRVGLTAPGVRSKNRLHEALSSLIDAMDEAGVVTEEHRIPATGFFEYDGRLHWSDSKVFKCALPEYSSRKTRRALEALEKAADFYAIRGVKDGDHLRHFLTWLYFITMAPLGVIRKIGGKEAKILLLHGQPHTGKTILEKMTCSIWGMSDHAAIIGSAKITGPQYAEVVNKTTLPISFDEARNALSSPGIADLLKSSTTTLHIKDRILRNFKMRPFMAYAGVIMSTNYLPELYAGMSDRLISIEFTRQHKRDNEAVRAFERFFNGDGKTLYPHIGSGLREMYLKKWETCKRLLMNEDPLKAGRELLMMLYKGHDLPVPEWMIEIKAVDAMPEEDDALKMIFDWMREDILRILRQNRRIDSLPTDWDARLDAIRDDNILPAYIKSISRDNINVTRELIREVARTGFELPGGLTGLFHLVNDHPIQVKKNTDLTNKGGSKVVRIERDLFKHYADKSDIQLEII